MTEKQNCCELCGLEEKLTKHHLIPQLKCKNKYKKMKNDDENFLWICEACHRTIHANFSENELRDLYNTKEKLLETEQILNFVKWKRKHQNSNISPTKMSRK